MASFGQNCGSNRDIGQFFAQVRRQACSRQADSAFPLKTHRDLSMNTLANYPVLVFFASFVCLWTAAQIGARALIGTPALEPDEQDKFVFVLGAVLTLLGLIAGFTFSMAVGRYDQRKNYEEEEANAIGTEYVRAELLPAADAEKIQGLLIRYLDQRIQWHDTRTGDKLRQIDRDTAQLQSEMWSAVKDAAARQPTPVSALAASGMNDVLNSQGYTQAAWLNRIPVAAWALILAIGICSNFLLGFTVRQSRPKVRSFLVVVLPLVLSISFFLLADIDSPRRGVIRVHPQNLQILAASFHS
jgi:hypothetical protein